MLHNYIGNLKTNVYSEIESNLIRSLRTYVQMPTESARFTAHGPRSRNLPSRSSARNRCTLLEEWEFSWLIHSKMVENQGCSNTYFIVSLLLIFFASIPCRRSLQASLTLSSAERFSYDGTQLSSSCFIFTSSSPTSKGIRPDRSL